MSWQDAKKFAELHLEHLPLNLKGRSIQVADFDLESDCRAFYPDRSLGFHRMILAAVRKLAWKRGTKLIVPVVLMATSRFMKLDQAARTDFADRSFMSLEVRPSDSTVRPSDSTLPI
jgi:hypothetical protein